MTELKSNAEWKQWGKDDPLFGVAAWVGKEKDGASPWTEDEFYALGESDWRDFLGHWQHYGVSKQSCLEIGCGAGRITKQLASYFDRVYAVDISSEMISCAQRAVKGGNVEFSVIDGLHLPQGDGSVKAIFTTIVLQHLDNKEIGFSYFREFYRVLAADGTIMVGDRIIAAYRTLTGEAPLLPLWAYGFWQSRLQYETQQEMLDVAAKYRELK